MDLNIQHMLELARSCNFKELAHCLTHAKLDEIQVTEILRELDNYQCYYDMGYNSALRDNHLPYDTNII